MSDLDDTLARWRSQTEAVTPPAELMAELTALAAAQTALLAAGTAVSATPAAGTAVATKGVALKVWLVVTAVGVVGAGAVVASRVKEREATPVVVESAPLAPPAAAPTPAVRPPAVRPPAAKPDGYLTVRANKDAVVFVDGVKVGRTPIERRPLRPGSHQLLINCISDAGATYSAGVKRIELPPGAEYDITNTCVEKYVYPDGGAVAP